MDVAALCHARLNCKSADEVESRRAAMLQRYDRVWRAVRDSG